MKKSIVSFVLLFAAITVFGQAKYLTKNGKIYFNATSSIEKIDATNEKVVSTINDAGALEFLVAMRAFKFERALMEEHFHENYVESDKYPKASFKGTITNMSTVDLKKSGTYPVKVKGMMNLHGVTKEVNADGNLTVKDGHITAATSKFKILLEDFNIEIPSLVKDKIAKEVQIDVDLNYLPM